MSDAAKNASPRGYFVGALMDTVGPIATFFVLNALGVPPLAAMIYGTLVAVASTVVNTVKRKRLDAIGVLVIAEITASIVMQLLIHDVRLLMAKPSVYSLIGGVFVLSTLFRGQPITYIGARPMATKGDPERSRAYDLAWENSAPFRAIHRTATLGWGIAFLADAVLRVVILYALPPDRSLLLSNAPHIAAIALLAGFSAFMGKRSKPLVEAQLELLRREPTPARSPEG